MDLTSDPNIRSIHMNQSEAREDGTSVYSHIYCNPYILPRENLYLWDDSMHGEATLVLLLAAEMLTRKKSDV